MPRKTLLNAYGIALAPAVMAQSVREAVNAAEQLGYPCVLKVASIDIPHKTEIGALRVGLENKESVQKAYDEMLAAVKAKKPDANIEGVLVQKQIKGVECLLGISRDEQLGPTLVMGLGGIFVEILADVAIRIPPINAGEARRALENLKGAKVFTGVRGAPPADIDALAEMAARLSWLAYDLRNRYRRNGLESGRCVACGSRSVGCGRLGSDTLERGHPHSIGVSGFLSEKDRDSMTAGALEGTVCIEVSGHVAGPYAGSLLGDLGCEVIKVELPNGGDTHRGRNPKYEGYGPSFRALNRNKKSLTLNLRDKKGARDFVAVGRNSGHFARKLPSPDANRVGPRL